MEDYTIVECYKYDGQYFETMDALNKYKEESIFNQAIEECLFRDEYNDKLSITISDLLKLCEIDSEAFLNYLKNETYP